MGRNPRGDALDDLDRAILDRLGKNARITNSAIARQLDVTEKTVRNRIGRLTEKHGLRVTATIDEPELEPLSRSRMLFLLQAVPAQRFTTAESLAQRPEVERVLITTGSADLIVAAAFPDDATAIEFFVHHIEGHPGVRSAMSCHLVSELDVDAHHIDGTSRVAPILDKDVVTDALASRDLDASPNQLLDWIATTARRALGADRVLVSYIEFDEPTTLRAEATVSYGLSDDYVQQVSSRWYDLASDDVSVLPKVVRSRQHVLIEDVQGNPWLMASREVVEKEGYKSALALPMAFGDEVIGVLGLYYDQRIDPSDQHIAVAQSLADHFAVALARAARKPSRG